MQSSATNLAHLTIVCFLRSCSRSRASRRPGVSYVCGKLVILLFLPLNDKDRPLVLSWDTITPIPLGPLSNYTDDVRWNLNL